jgi:hypothetical protein
MVMEDKSFSVVPHLCKLLLKNSFWDYDYGWVQCTRLFFCPDKYWAARRRLWAL